jgi:hypothetical protein
MRDNNDEADNAGMVSKVISGTRSIAAALRSRKAGAQAMQPAHSIHD